MSFKQLLFVLCIWFSRLNDVTSYWTNFEVSSIESMNGTEGKPIDPDLHVTRIKRGSYGISGHPTMTDDIQGYTAEIVVFHSAQRNNDFKMLPFKIPEGPLCKLSNSLYRKYVMNEVRGVSDLPYTDDPMEDLCLHFSKGKTFEIKNFQFNENRLEKFLAPGLYKGHIVVRKDGTVTSGIVAIIDLS